MKLVLVTNTLAYHNIVVITAVKRLVQGPPSNQGNQLMWRLTVIYTPLLYLKLLKGLYSRAISATKQLAFVDWLTKTNALAYHSMVACHCFKVTNTLAHHSMVIITGEKSL